MTTELLADTAALEPVAVAVFLGAGAVILVAELYGVVAKGRRGDTISELLWHIRDRLPLPAKFVAAVSSAAALGWLWWHIFFQG